MFQVGLLAVCLSVGATMVSSAKADTALPQASATGFSSNGTWSVSPGFNVLTAETGGVFGALSPSKNTGFAMAQVSYSLEVFGQSGVTVPVLASMPGIVSVSTKGLAAATATLSYQLFGPSGLASMGTLGFQNILQQGGSSDVPTGFQKTFQLLANTVYTLMLNTSVSGFALAPGSAFHALAVLDPQFSISPSFKGEGPVSIQLSDGVVNQLGISSAPAPVPGAGFLSFLVAGFATLRRRLRHAVVRVTLWRRRQAAPRLAAA